MSIYKGTQLIAANGAPGAPGVPGADGINGNGVLVVATCTEISNNIDYNNTDQNSGRNYVDGNQSWCKVGGYRSGLGNAGQAADVFGYGCFLNIGTGAHVEGYGTTVGDMTQGAHIEGMNNYVKIANPGVHIEGHSIGDMAPVGQDVFANGIEVLHEGIHMEGFGHKGISIQYSDGAHIGGYGITANTPALSMPHQRSGYESGYIEMVGLKHTSNVNGEFARVMRNDGSMAIAGDMAFTALDSAGNAITTGTHADGRYTLGEIVEALITAGILNPPV